MKKSSCKLRKTFTYEKKNTESNRLSELKLQVNTWK